MASHAAAWTSLALGGVVDVRRVSDGFEGLNENHPEMGLKRPSCGPLRHQDVLLIHLMLVAKFNLDCR